MNCHHQALLGQYDFKLWESIEKFKELLPENPRQEFSSLMNKGRQVARTSLHAVLNVEDSAARAMSSTMAMHRSSWLQSSGFPYEVQNAIQNFPFECPSLFSGQKDSKCDVLNDSRATLKSLGLYMPAPVRKHY